MSKMRIVSLAVALLMATGVLTACGTQTSNSPDTSAASSQQSVSAAESSQQVVSNEKVEIDVITTDPEYMTQDREIWDLYEKSNANVKINLSSVNEDQAASLDARVAAGNAPDIQEKRTGINKDNYTTFVNLNSIDYPYWDKFTYDYKKLVADTLSIPTDYLPVINPFSGRYYQFTYYKDMVQKAGLDPKSIKTMDDFDKFLSDAKANLSKTGAQYLFDIGWDSQFQGAIIPSAVAVALGYKNSDLADTYTGKIKWTDESGPYAAAFIKLKEWYDKGYMTERFWARSWDKEYEPSFVAKKSLLAFHGPWIFAKVEAADPDAELSGFTFPANKDGNIFAGPVSTQDGAVMFTVNQDKPEFSETVKALIWYCSPEIVKLRCEAMGFYPTMDLSGVGGANIKATQYMEVVKPVAESKTEKWESSVWPEKVMSKYLVAGKPDVMQDDAMAVEYGKYFEGKTSLKDFLQLLENRWKDSYNQK